LFFGAARPHQQPAASSQQPAASSQQPAASSSARPPIDWIRLHAHLTTTGRRWGWSTPEAEDFASEAIVRTLRALGATPDRSVGEVWMHAKTTCRHLAASQARASSRRPRADWICVDPAARAATEGNSAPARGPAHAIVHYLLQTTSGTQNALLMLLLECPDTTNADVASTLGVSIRAVELARQTIRIKTARAIADGTLPQIRSTTFGPERPSP
jgi:DNA-directed RNA polymerase specialized sigma24 family protein